MTECFKELRQSQRQSFIAFKVSIKDSNAKLITSKHRFCFNLTKLFPLAAETEVKVVTRPPEVFCEKKVFLKRDNNTGVFL